MNSLTVICLLVVLPVCAGISCYICLPASSGCDPFSSSGSGVTNSTGNNACRKVNSGITSATYRDGQSSCTNNNAYGVGTFCCTTDFCNGASGKYQAPFLMGLVIAALFAKYQFL